MMKMATRLTALGAATLLGLGLFSCGDTQKGFDYSAGLDKNGFFEGVKASELVTLPAYKGIEIDQSVITATDEAMQEQIDSIIASYSEYERITDRAIVDGDTVNIDYVGSIDGVEFDGGSTGGLGTTVTIGVTNYIDDFLEQLIGHKPGETIQVEATFPEDYGNEEVNGKDAVFVTTINYIQGELTNTELTDEIAQDYGFSTTDEMLADIEDWLIGSQKFNFFSDLLTEATCEEVPQSVLDYVIAYDVEQCEYYASLYGMTTETFFTMQGYESEEDYIDANMSVYTENAVMYLAAQAIAELEGIEISDAELEASEYYSYVSEYGEPYLKQYILFQEVLPEFIVSNGIVQ